MQNVLSPQFKEQVLDHAGLVIVKFWAAWCGPCRALALTLEQLETERLDIKFVQINTDEESALSDQYQIKAIPTLVIFKSGQEVYRIIGAVPKNIILEKINAIVPTTASG